MFVAIVTLALIGMTGFHVIEGWTWFDSLYMVLTTFTTLLVVIASWQNVEKRVAQYMGAFLILEGLMIGVFAALDGVLKTDRANRL